MELIKKWLAGKRNFYIGAVLYGQFGKDANLKKYFTGAPDPVKQKKLEAELIAMLEKPRAILQAPAANPDIDTMPESEDAVLKALRNEWQPLYQRMNYLRHELDRHEGNSPEAIARRKPIAFDILSLEQQCMKIWTRRDHYLEHGQLPEVKTEAVPIPEDPLELNRVIDTLKRNIRRNKLEMRKHPDKTNYPLKVKQYQAQLDQILRQLEDGK